MWPIARVNALSESLCEQSKLVYYWHLYPGLKICNQMILYSSSSIWMCSKALCNDRFTPSRLGTHCTDPVRMESRANFSRKGGHPNI